MQLLHLKRTLGIIGRSIMFVFIMLGAAFPSALAAPPAQQTPNTLRVGLPAPETLDPTQLSRFDHAGRDIVENLFVGLTRINPLTFEVEPGVASSWSVSDDGLTWTFELREDVWWVRSDPDTGAIEPVRPVVAGDFVYAIQRSCDPLRPSPLTANLMVIRGCQTVRDAFPEVISDIFIAQEIAARATSPHTLEIELLFPTSYFLSLASTPEYRPLPREAVANHENWTAPDQILTNGPYVLQAHTSQGLTLVSNPHWPDTIEGNIEQVDVSFVDETDNLTQRVQNGDLDLVRLPPAQTADAARALPDLFQQTSGETLVFFGFAYDRVPVDQAEVRRALAQSIDRQALVDQFFPYQAQPATQFTPPGVTANPERIADSFQPLQAQQALSAAGYPNCEGIPESIIVLVPDDDPVWAQIGQFVIDQWAQNLGCNLALFEVRTLSRPLMLEIAHSTYDSEIVTRSHVWLATWTADYDDADNWLSGALHCRYGYVRSGRPCDTADTLLDQAASALSAGERAALYSQVEASFFGPGGSFPVIPLFYTTTGYLQQSWLSNVALSGPARFDQWTIDRADQP